MCFAGISFRETFNETLIMIINYNCNDINPVKAFRDRIFLPPLCFSVYVLKKVSGKQFCFEKKKIFLQISN